MSLNAFNPHYPILIAMLARPNARVRKLMKKHNTSVRELKRLASELIPCQVRCSISVRYSLLKFLGISRGFIYRIDPINGNWPTSWVYGIIERKTSLDIKPKYISNAIPSVPTMLCSLVAEYASHEYLLTHYIFYRGHAKYLRLQPFDIYEFILNHGQLIHKVYKYFGYSIFKQMYDGCSDLCDLC